MKKKYQLHNLKLDEVSLVDVGANQMADVVLYKRDDIEKAVKGVKFVIGFPEDGGSKIQSVLFDKEDWDQETASKWLSDNKLSSDKLDETSNSLRYRQEDPENFKDFRTITPGQKIAKLLLNTENSFNEMMNDIQEVLNEKYPMQCPWVRDLFANNVVFQVCDDTYRWEFATDENGKITMSGDPIPVNICYQDETEETEKAAPMKKEGDYEFPASAYAYVPDESSPSTWKLRLWETPETKATAKQVGMAMAAMGKGFRGNKVEIPESEMSSVREKVLAAWKQTHDKTEEVPDVLKKGDQSMENTELASKVDEIQETAKAAKENNEELRKNLDEVTKRLEAAEARANAAESIAKAETEKRELAELSKVAETQYGNLPGKPEEKAQILKAINEKLTDEEAKKVHELLKAGNEAMKQTTTSIGKSTTSEGANVSSAYDRLDAMAKEHVGKTAGSNYYQAFEHVVKMNPELYQQYLKEKQSAA